MKQFFNNSFLLSIILAVIIISEGIPQTGTIIINKVTNPATVAPEFNFTPFPTLKINLPIEYTFVASYAVFGPQLDQTGVTGTLQLVSDLGCNPGDFAGFVPGNIAVIDRGTCQFTDKVLNAQNAGASGVIILDYSFSDWLILVLGGDDPGINIPAVSLSYADGLILKSLIGAGSTATMLNVFDNFSLKHGETKTFENVPAGYYAITENFLQLDGVELADILISDPSSGSSIYLNRFAFLRLEAGETIEVTFISDITIVEDLISDIEELLQNGVINSGQANALTVKLENAKNRFDAGQVTAALNLLNAFINQVSDFTQNGLLTPAQGQLLIDQANNLIALITGSLPKNFSANILKEFELFQNYPNPFNPSTSISWQLPVSSHQALKIYDVLGNEVAVLVDEFREAGYHSVIFDASGLSSGIYFYTLQTEGFIQTKKLLLMK